jgi:hypothetical protein
METRNMANANKTAAVTTVEQIPFRMAPPFLSTHVSGNGDDELQCL